MPVERMIEKAQKLLKSGNVERLDIGVFKSETMGPTLLSRVTMAK